ncbi:MAG: DUF2721 domain-containing protein [Acidobacteria bacterium]|nr:DUF2721 domain-containing protein [Acidobacteriota bacterium]
MPLRELVSILQLAVIPVILISGVGLLLLSLTNRFGRVVDRSRLLLTALRSATEADRKVILSEIEILSTRALIVRQAIAFATVSVLFATVLVITLFVAAVLQWETGIVVVTLFICCMLSLIGSLVAFLRDINLSMAALRLELAKKNDRAA